MSHDTQSETARFKSAVVPLAIAMFVVTAGLFTARVALKYGMPFDWGQLASRLIYAVIVTPIAAGLLAMSFPYTVTCDGLHGYSVWGVRRFIRWSDIDDVRTIWLLNLKYLRLHSRADGKATWVLLMLRDSNRFRDLIHRYAGLDSPVSRHLQ